MPKEGRLLWRTDVSKYYKSSVIGVSYNGIISGSNPQDKGSIPLAPAN